MKSAIGPRQIKRRWMVEKRMGDNETCKKNRSVREEGRLRVKEEGRENLKK